MNAFYLVVMIGMVFSAGCAHNNGNNGQLESYPVAAIEEGWIRNGEPIIFSGYKWYPVDDIETLTDSEVYQVGEYQGVQFFVDKVDTKPYNRLYTKYSRGKFRYFERRND